jgi:hypothetical protein
MGFIVFIFMLRYSSNVAFVMHPEWRGTLAVQATLAVVLGLVSGLAIGRAIGLLRLMRPVPLAGTATATIGTHA